jgi:hypothetical protein
MKPMYADEQIKRTELGPLIEVKSLAIPLPASGMFDVTNIAILQVPVPLTRYQWDTMLKILEAMRPGLVRAYE